MNPRRVRASATGMGINTSAGKCIMCRVAVQLRRYPLLYLVTGLVTNVVTSTGIKPYEALNERSENRRTSRISYQADAKYRIKRPAAPPNTLPFHARIYRGIEDFQGKQIGRKIGSALLGSLKQKRRQLRHQGYQHQHDNHGHRERRRAPEDVLDRYAVILKVVVDDETGEPERRR
jgi:hypothetical protein